MGGGDFPIQQRAEDINIHIQQPDKPISKDASGDVGLAVIGGLFSIIVVLLTVILSRNNK